MSTLAPKLQDQISYERPVGAAPSALGSAVGALLDLGDDFVRAQAKGGPSESDKKGMALSEYVSRLDEISMSETTPGEQTRLAERARRDFLTRYPQYRTDILEISSAEFGFDPGEADPRRAITDGFNEWLQSPKGMAAAATIPGIGSGDVAASTDTESRLYAAFLRDNATQADIARLADSQATDEIKWRTLSGAWTQNTVEAAAGMAINATQNPELRSNPEIGMNILDQAISTTRNQMLAEGAAAGIDPHFLQARLDSVVAPLVALRETWHSNLENPGRVLDAFTKANELGVTEAMVSAIGPIASDPVAREIFYTQFLSNEINGENITRFMETVTQMQTNNEFNPVTLGVSVMPGVDEVITEQDAAVVSPATVTEWRNQEAQNPGYLQDRVALASGALANANLETSEGKQAAMVALQHINVATEAYQGPMGVNTLRRLFTPQNIDKIKALGPEGEALLAATLIKQVRHNRALVAESGTLTRDARIRIENGRFIAERRLRFGMGEWTPVTDGQLGQSVAAVNEIANIAFRVPGIASQIQNATQWLYRGVEPSREQINQETTWSNKNIEEASVTATASPNPLLPLIDRTEGAGSYDTLFGHSQRGNGRFAGIKVSEMTIGEALQFADTSGAYGQWVKEELGRIGHTPRVATPMGRYQFVGTTLRSVAEQMGLSMDTLFDQRTQDAMFDFHARQTLRGKTGQAALNAIRGQWEGFKNVSDEELLRAVNAFKGLPPVDPSTLNVAGGSNRQSPLVDNVLSTRGNGDTGESGDVVEDPNLGAQDVRTINPGSATAGQGDGRTVTPSISGGEQGGGEGAGEEGRRGSRQFSRETRERIRAALSARDGQRASDEDVDAILQALEEAQE